MISYDFDYYKPASIEEATRIFHTLQKQDKKPVYFAGGTEIITLGRLNQITADAVIDLKSIPEMCTYEEENGQLILGAGLTLSQLQDIHLFPFLEKVTSQIADKTARNKITLGGNICANIIYREAVLPLLLTDSHVVIATEDGLKEKPIKDLFREQLQLEPGEFLVQTKTDVDAINEPHFALKKRRQWGVGYPLITTAAVLQKDKISIAFSGLCAFPFRNEQIDSILNKASLSTEERMDQVISHLPAPVLDDVHGSDAYRTFVLKNIIQDVLHTFGRREA